MVRGTTFKAQYRQAQARSTTPPQPYVEPLSPIESQSTVPAYVEPARDLAHAASSPIAYRAYTRDVSYSHYDRPAKRARSEFYTSPPYNHYHSRPATSHIPGWSYNVEQMVDSGTRMYQTPVAFAPFAPQPAPGSDPRISDAELLLNFAVSAHAAQTPPSTAKRWSLSYPPALEQPPAELPLLQTQQTLAPSSPYAAATQPPSRHVPHTDAPPADFMHLPAPPVQPVDAPPAETAPAAHTYTPPEEMSGAASQPVVQVAITVEAPEAAPAPAPAPAAEAEPKPKKHQGWPKGKPRGPRSTPSTGKRKRSTPKPKTAPPTSASGAPDQLQSPQSLPAEHPDVVMAQVADPLPHQVRLSHDTTLQPRRHSFSTPKPQFPSCRLPLDPARAQSVPLNAITAVTPPAEEPRQSSKKPAVEQPDLICAACKSSDSEVKVGDGEQWIGCDGCKEWYHYACAGFSSEREVRDVNKFYCEPCRPKFGETTKVRKSIRAHTTVDYAGLNEGVLKTSDDNPEHHYIAAFKNGDIDFTPETFARMPPELITRDFLEKSNGFKEPILIPGALNPRPYLPVDEQTDVHTPTDESVDRTDEQEMQFEYETVANEGQDKLDMVIPQGLTVRRVAELYGANETVPVIDVKAQEGEVKKWTMAKWADYYEQQGEKPVRNVISLEVSRSRLGRLIRRPKAVRDMDLQDSVWREDDKFAPPPVQFYCLMSVADCFTDFHIDFGGSSVYYHIVKGKKVFFFIPPTKQNLKKYEDWCLSPNQGHDWLGKQVKECYRVDLYPGDTMLIPSGWIHAVWTPEDSLVIGGNFLTRIHYGMQIKILEIEINTKVAAQFRYPFFQKIMWLTVIKYLEEDPVPGSVEKLLQSGHTFKRSVPIFCEPDRFGHNSHLGPPNYNSRYYSKHELEGLTEVLNYIWRTVLISLDKIDVPSRTRSAVNRSIPKGHGDPLILAKRFAMWIAWKRGDETIPSWAMSDAGLPEPPELGEKKMSAAQVKKMERDSQNEALRGTAERHSARIRASDPPIPGLPAPSFYQDDPVLPFDGPLTGFLRPSSGSHITTPKTSQLGPKRVACDACRKRRIRCKHKDELIDTSKPGMHTIDLSGSYGISVKRRLSDHSIVDGLITAVNGPVTGGPIMADANGDPYALKSGRVKACADCRKSKRRCIHDEYGNVDPVKANEVPIPRGSASKKRRVSEEDSTTAKRMRQESAFDGDMMNGDLHTRHSLPHQFSVNASMLQDVAYAAQQTFDHDPEDDMMPIDPALQAYNNADYSPMNMTTPQPNNGDTIISSIEYHPTTTTTTTTSPTTDADFPARQGPSVEPLTPGPPPFPNTSHHPQTNGYTTHHLSSPVSPTNTSPTSNNYNMYTTASDFPPPPITPTTTAATTATAATRPYRAPNTNPPSSSRKASKTPKSTPGFRRRDSQHHIKLELGMGLGLGMNLDMLGMGVGVIDPQLDEASRNLIKQLQQEDMGLRRRSR
ncbi:hypothetical protein P153DRAFT_278420 [Dothidotthia symphoricarpi CBS 119687]|uniref:JmjC domain-containing histone demethylation protein 1 n=1 Tax=Dothidotthia symphoricarpi CBS 119687 TaxID=1392245 RepID=A0A6A6AUH4_9PLEO|nr:uncharacterized protein P153DRAFT_278420 [Dothidotthia symphoricarpi CBS 119687]KAF2134584.1 hypothetical protein P153DRAFT_278420 [Dothidotthia symphoricarpi CBS 119687]